MMAPATPLFRPELATVVAPVPCEMAPSVLVTEAIAWMGVGKLLCDLTNGISGDQPVRHAQRSCVLVFEAEYLVGIVTEWDLVELSASAQDLAEVTLAEVMTSPVLTLCTTDFVDAWVPLALFERHHIHHLPLVDDRGHVVGILTDESLRQALNSIGLLQELTVTEVVVAVEDMARPIVQAAPTTCLAELARLMFAHHTDSVVIVDQANQLGETTVVAVSQLDTQAPFPCPVGIVTAREIAQGLALNLDLATIQAQDLITAPMVAVQPETSLWTVQQLMPTKGPVMVVNPDGAIVGLVHPAALLNLLHPSTFHRLAERHIQERNRILAAQIARHQLLTQIACQIRATLNLQEVLDAVVAGVRSILQCDRVLIQQFQPDWSGVIVAESVGGSWTRALGNSVEDTCFRGNQAALYPEGRMIAIGNVHEAGYTDCHLALLQQYQVKANLVAPILVSGQLWGLLIGHQCHEYRSWQKTDLTLLHEIGVQLAIAIQQAISHQQLQGELQVLQQSELELQQQRELLRTIIDTIPNKIFIKDREGRFLLANRAIAEAYQTTVEALIGNRDSDFHPDPSSTARFLQENQAVIDQQQCLFIPEEQGLSIHGNEQWFQWQKHPIILPGENIPAALGIGVEITRHKTASRAFRQYERIVSATTDGIALLDRNYVYQLVNQVYLKWHNKSREEIVGYSVAELLGEDIFQTLVKPRLDRCLAGEVEQYEAWFDYKNGGQRFVSVIYAPYLEEDGTVTGIVVTTHDLTSIKRAETQLEMQNGILEQIARARPLPEILDMLLRTMELQLVDALCSIMLCDDQGILHSGPAPHLPVAYLQAIDGVAAGEGVGSCGTAVFRRETVIVSDIATDPLWQNYRDLALSYGLKTCWSFPIFASDGRVLGTFGVYYRDERSPQPQDLINMTKVANIAGIAIEQQQAKQALEQLNQDLETRIAERTIALQASEERWQSVLRGTNDAIWDWDVPNQRLFYSSRWKAMRGLAEEEVGDRLEEWSRGVHPDDHARVMAAIEAHFAGETEFFEMEYRVRHQDGSYFWIVDRGQAFRDASGQVIRMSGSETDITQRKRAEADRDRLLSFLQASANEIYVFSAATLRFEYINQSALRNLGYSLEMLQTMTPVDIKPDFTEATFRQILQPLLNGRQIQCVFQTRHQRADGSLYAIEVHLQLQEYLGEQFFLAVILDISERKLAEEALRNSERRYRAVIDFASDAILLADIQGDLIEGNQKALELLGYRRDELMQMQMNQIHPAAVLEAVHQHFSGIILYNQGAPFETLVLRKDGSHVPVEITSNLIELEGEPIIQGIFRDIRDRKQAEQENQRLKERLQFVLSSSPAVLYTCEARGNFDCTFISENVEPMLGYTPADYLSEPGFWLSHIHPEDRPVVLADLHTLFERGHHTHEYRFLRRDGSYCWLQDELRLIRDEQGMPLEIVGYFADISDRKQAEQQLRDVSERLNLAIQAAKIGIWEWDIVNKRLIWDDRMCDLYGVSPENFAGHYEDWQQRVHPDDLASQAELEQQALRGERTGDTEFRIVCPDGSIRFLRGHSLIRRNELGEPQRAFGLNLDITDRKLAEQENQQLKERLQFLLSSSPAVIFTCKPGGDYGATYIGDNVVDVVGYTPNDFLSESNFWADQVHPEDVPGVFDITSKLFEQGHHIHEYRFQHREGHYLWVREQVRLVRDEQGVPIEVVGYFADISDRKQAELDLKSSEARFRQVFDSSVVGMLFANLQGQILEANDRFLDIVGYSRADLETGLVRWDAITPPEYAAADQVAIAQLRQFGKSDPREKEYYRKDGSRAAILIGTAILPDAPDQVVAVVLDISDRKRLERSQQRLITILEASTDYISMTDGATGRQIWNNAAIKQLCGIESDAAVARRTAEDYHPQWAIERLQQEALPTAITTGSWLGETALLDAQGQEIPVSELVLAHKSPQGEVEFFSAIMRDMRVHKEYEQRLERTNMELRRATRLKDEFLANMSHELRTPLNAILGMAEAMQEQVFGEVNERQRNALNTIDRTGLHLLALINDILDLAKVESGQIDLDRVATDVAALCQASLDLIKPQAFKKKIQLSLQLPASLPNLWLDERRMRQALVNLLNNAVKFTGDEGRVTLEVSLPIRQEIGAAESYWLRFAVSDTGIGIASENLDKLFQPFVQIDSALNRHYEGTGLGLALVKRIVELHGGRVGLTSEVGVGSCFTIDLPVIQAELTTAEPQPQRSVSFDASQSNQPTAPLILLVEDNEDNIVTVASYLEVKGNRLLIARDGEEAIALAEAERPDLILMDIQMPGMDGIEAIQRIRQLPDLADIPIIALTALVMEGDRERCLAAGATDYISKPVKLKQLAATIQQCLEA